MLPQQRLVSSRVRVAPLPPIRGRIPVVAAAANPAAPSTSPAQRRGDARHAELGSGSPESTAVAHVDFSPRSLKGDHLNAEAGDGLYELRPDLGGSLTPHVRESRRLRDAEYSRYIAQTRNGPCGTHIPAAAHVLGLVLLSSVVYGGAALSRNFGEMGTHAPRPLLWLPMGAVLISGSTVGWVAGLWAAPGAAAYAALHAAGGDGSAAHAIAAALSQILYLALFLFVRRRASDALSTVGSTLLYRTRYGSPFDSCLGVLTTFLGCLCSAALAAGIESAAYLFHSDVALHNFIEQCYAWTLSNAAGAAVSFALIFACGDFVRRLPEAAALGVEARDAVVKRDARAISSIAQRIVGSALSACVRALLCGNEPQDLRSCTRSQLLRALETCAFGLSIVGLVSAQVTEAESVTPSHGLLSRALPCVFYAAIRYSLFWMAAVAAAFSAGLAAAIEESRSVASSIATTHDIITLYVVALFTTSVVASVRELVATLHSTRLRLREAKVYADHTARTKTRFLANMSHELRTPLNGIIGNARIVAAGSLADEQKSCMQDVLTSADHLLTVLNDILLLSKMEFGDATSSTVSESDGEDSDGVDSKRRSSERATRGGSARRGTKREDPELSGLSIERPKSTRSFRGMNAFLLSPTLLNLQRTVEDAATLAYDSEKHGHVSLAVVIAPTTPLTIIGDATRLRQVLFNLLSNALKFVEAGEVELSVRPLTREEVNSSKTEALVGRRAAADYLRRTADMAVEAVDGIPDPPLAVRFSVRDTGIGIAPPHQASVFEAFHQADGGVSRRYGGTGLGLAITHRLVRAMGGCMALSSEVGVGSEFSFFIPAFCIAPGRLKREKSVDERDPGKQKSYRNDRVEAKEASNGDICRALRLPRRTRAIRGRTAVILQSNETVAKAISVWVRAAQMNEVVISKDEDVAKWVNDACSVIRTTVPRRRPAIVFVDGTLTRQVMPSLQEAPETESDGGALLSRNIDAADKLAPLGAWLSRQWPMVPVVLTVPKDAVHHEVRDRGSRRLRIIQVPVMPSDVQCELVNAARWAAGKSGEEALHVLRTPAQPPTELSSRSSPSGLLPTEAGNMVTFRPHSASEASERSELSTIGSVVAGPLGGGSVSAGSDRDDSSGFTTARVLLVEDNKINQRVAQRMLKSLGCEVLLADDGRHALEQLGIDGEARGAARGSSAETNVDFVLMDMQMPIMDGMAATRAIRDAGALGRGGNRLPVVALTANAFDSDKKSCIDSGMDAFMTKPISRSAIASALTSHVAHMHCAQEDS